MATIYSGAGGSVTMTPGNLPRAMKQLVNAVLKGVKKGGKKSLYDIRTMVTDGIKSNSLGLNPLKESTLAARANPSPGRPVKRGTVPLNYSGESLKGIKVRINGDSMTLGFDDAATISYNKMNMGKVAYMNEYGFTIKGVYTKKMLAYLHILFKKQFGKDAAAKRDFVRAKGWAGAGRTGVRIGSSYTRKVDPRPAWEKATLKALPQVEVNFTEAIIAEVNKTGLVI